MPPRKKKSSIEDAVVYDITSRESRLAACERLKTSINSSVKGDPLVQSMSDIDHEIDVISTRILSLDIATGVGGIPRGRITEFYGVERSGKSTTALQTCAVCQQAGGIILYVDSEHALDKKYCTQLGLDVDDPSFILVQTTTADDAFNTIIKYLDARVVDLIIIDSLANMVPLSMDEQYHENGVGKALVGTKARLSTAFTELAVSRVHKSNAAMIVLQQMRTKMAPGQPVRETSASPNSVKHNTSLRIKFSRVSDTISGLRGDESMRGDFQESIAKVEKNKVGPPFMQSLFRLGYGSGADYYLNLVNSCIVYKIPNVIPGGKNTIVDDNGEEICKFYPKGAAETLRNYPDTVSLLVDKLSDMVGINLYDPARPNRHVGPYADTIPMIEEFANEEVDLLLVEAIIDDEPDVPSY